MATVRPCELSSSSSSAYQTRDPKSFSVRSTRLSWHSLRCEPKKHHFRRFKSNGVSDKKATGSIPVAGAFPFLQSVIAGGIYQDFNRAVLIRRKSAQPGLCSGDQVAVSSSWAMARFSRVLSPSCTAKCESTGSESATDLSHPNYGTDELAAFQPTREPEISDVL